jgi:hypothetical protein
MSEKISLDSSEKIYKHIDGCFGNDDDLLSY